MNATSLTPPSTQMIITLEDNAMVAEIKKAREEYAKGETVSCHTPEEMQKFFDSL